MLATAEELRVRVDCSKLAELGRVHPVRVTLSARRDAECEIVRLKFLRLEHVPGHEAETPVEEFTLAEGDLRLSRGQSQVYAIQLAIPQDLPPSYAGSFHSLGYRLVAEAVSAYDLVVGSGERLLNVSASRSRSGLLQPVRTDPVGLERTYRGDLLFGLFPVGGVASCSVELQVPVFRMGTRERQALMLGTRVHGNLRVAARRHYREAQLYFGYTLKGGGKTDLVQTGGPITLPLDAAQSAEFSFSLPDRAPVNFEGSRLSAAWYLRVDAIDEVGSAHREDFAFSVLPKLTPPDAVPAAQPAPVQA
ncbi:MAG: hypothetical protein AB1758_34915, partial [Candidatus Eremiobacterota bacterium]